MRVLNLVLFLILSVFSIGKNINVSNAKDLEHENYCINKQTYEVSMFKCGNNSAVISKELFDKMDYSWSSTVNDPINKHNKNLYVQNLSSKKKISDKKSTETHSQIMAKMTPEEKRAYTCNKIYGFWTWGSNYKDCLIKLQAADLEKQRADLEKQRIIEQQRIQAYQENQRLIEQQRIQAYQEQQNKIAQEQIDRADNLRRAQILLDYSRSLNPPPRSQTNCQTTYMGAIAQTRCY
jgi:phage-related minor tail protein